MLHALSNLMAGIFIVATVYFFVQRNKGKKLKEELENGGSAMMEKMSDIENKKRLALIAMAVSFILIGVLPGE